MSSINYIEDYPPFQKDFKKLKKRYKSLEEDFKLLKKATIELYHNIPSLDNGSIKEIQGYEGIYKIRKIACRSLKGKGVQSGLRVIYSFSKATNTVTFIEFYFKGDKTNEDKDRINYFIKD